jgi:hypothetical protein
MSRLANEVTRQPRFCWLCYRESVLRAAAGLPRAAREALLAEAGRHRLDGGPVIPTPFEHARHAGARPVPGNPGLRGDGPAAGQENAGE